MRRRHLAPLDVETCAVEITSPDPGAHLLEPPPVDHAEVRLEPVLEVRPLLPETPPPDVDDVDLRPTIDVVPLALVTTLFAERARDVRLPGARVASMSLVRAELRSPPPVPEPARVVVAHPDRAARMFRRATPPDRLPTTHVRECLMRLFRQSRLSSPAELTLIGIFERIPGGAVRSVSQHPHGVVLRLDHRASARPATLVVGKRRHDNALLTVEVEPLAGA